MYFSDFLVKLRFALCNNFKEIGLISVLITFYNYLRLRGFSLYTISFIYPHKKKSQGDRLGGLKSDDPESQSSRQSFIEK